MLADFFPASFRTTTPDVWPADPNDASALARLHASAFPLAGDAWGAGEFHALLSQPSAFAHRAVRAGALGLSRPEPRGFVLAREAGGEAEILTIAVHPSWHGRGIGRALMQAVLRELHLRRAEALFLEVNEGNRAAMGLYGSLGFVEVGRRASYYPARNGEHAAALTMRLDLRAS